MGLKLKWFRRRITFEGIPSAPERSIRKKETTGIATIGVYRQSRNYDDYLEPAKPHYWEPPPQPIARTKLRSITTSTKPSTPAAETRNATVADKIVPAKESNGVIDIPPEPQYIPPQPPVRKGFAKAKSVTTLSPNEEASASTVEHFTLTAAQSVEVLIETPRSPRIPPISPMPRATVPERSEPQQPEHPVHLPPTVVVAEDDNDFESFNVIFERVKSKPAPKSPEADPVTSIDTVTSPSEPRSPLAVIRQLPTELRSTPATKSPTPSPEPTTPVIVSTGHSQPPSPSSEPTTPVAVDIVQSPTPTSSKGLKSILKKRAPEVPPSVPAPVSPTTVDQAPAPQPRTKHNGASPASQTDDGSTPGGDDGTDGTDDYFNWDLVERHRSSINQTTAVQHIDSQVLKNLPEYVATSVPQTATKSIAQPTPQPRTLRAMRNQRAQPQEFVIAKSRRTSDSNDSEASA